MNSQELRQKFTDFFMAKNHQAVASSSLIPAGDPTLMFVNAGMVPFKEVFLGNEKRSYNKAVSVQKCMRVSGKHNDLDQVGFTARHHTFFEMMGNFSFGAYFKKEAISYAWEFLTKILQIPAEKLWITVFHEDDESAKIWLEDIKVDPNRFSKIAGADNFWSMGATGPCGPCTEIFYDHGPDVAGGPPGTPEEDGDRFVEIWNLVFMQYNRDKDGKMTDLPTPCVDTGMGIERLTAAVNAVHENYDTDLFMPIIEKVAKVTNCKDIHHRFLRVIADHLRSSSFLIAEGVYPSNEGRGYVLRRIVRRAILHGYQLGQKGEFFHELVGVLVKIMGDAYPELVEKQKTIEKILKKEEKQFGKTLEQGIKLLEKAVGTTRELSVKGQEIIIPGDVVFKLYDTYGFPVDLTATIAKERNIAWDKSGFEKCMQEQRERARAASQFAVKEKGMKLDVKSSFEGYYELECDGKITAILQDSQLIGSLEEGQKGMIVVDETSFYAASGGQVGDVGILKGDAFLFVVTDTQTIDEAIVHVGFVKAGEVEKGDKVKAIVDAQKRARTTANHTVTHLLHAALRQVLGDHVVQKGSEVAANQLRFDFAHFEAPTKEQFFAVEKMVNEKIYANLQIDIILTDIEHAKDMGAMALFGEKYGDKVRVVKIEDFSMELCGGTHVIRTGDIGLFKIVSEGSIASGVRRIEAVTRDAAINFMQKEASCLHGAISALKVSPEKLLDKLNQMGNKQKDLEKTIAGLQDKLASSAMGDLLQQVKEKDGVKFLCAVLETGDPKSLRGLVEQLKNKLQSAVVVLGLVKDGRTSLVAGVTADLTERFQAGNIIKELTAKIGGKGGGKADMAQGGGPEVANLQQVLEQI